MTNNEQKTLFLAILFFSITLFSCKVTYGVALTSTEQMEAGQIYKITGETFQREGFKPISFYIFSNGEKIVQERKAFFETFNSPKKADLFRAEYQPYTHIYAKSTSNHFIRSQKDSNAPDPYRMRAGETVKVLAIDENEVSIDNKKGHWLEVLTDDGYRGYSFDYKLKIIDKEAEKQSNENLKSNDRLLSLLSKRFYPDSYIDMINENRIDLKEINANNGFYYSPENDLIILRTGTVSKAFNTSKVIGISSNRYGMESTGLDINIISDNHIFVSYQEVNKTHSFNLYHIPNIEEIALKEIEQQATLYETLLEMGGNFSSSSYGTLTFNPDETFVWNQYERLVPSHIPENAGNTGMVSFKLYMTTALSQKYNDSIYLNFKNGRNINPVAFFITVMEEKGAIRLISIPKTYINHQNLILKDNQAPILIYFQVASR